MGRYRRNPRNAYDIVKDKVSVKEGKCRDMSIGNDILGARKVEHKNTNYPPFDTDIIQRYIMAYRHGVECNNTNSRSFTSLCGHKFPCLTARVLCQPYLSVPSTLSNEHRKTLYDICLDAGLYHTGIGSEHNRHAVISLCVDGLEVAMMEGSKNPPPVFPVRCRPWYTNQRTSELPSLDVTTRNGCETIQRLIDHPEIFVHDNDLTPIDCSALLDLSSPSSLFDSRQYRIIDTPTLMRQCIQELSKETELAFDLELYNPSKYSQVTCLLQLSTTTQEYVIDVLAKGVWDLISLLSPVFSDSNVIKIGHGVRSMDIPSLHRDFGIIVVNAFDTQIAASVLGLTHHLGLSCLCEYYGLTHSNDYKELKKRYQRADWRVRPLSDTMIQYGVYDVKYLILLRKFLMRDLVNAKRVTTQHGHKLWMFPALKNVITTSQQHCLALWKDHIQQPFMNYVFLRVSVKHQWNEHHMECYGKLVEWRNSVAKREGIMLDMVCSLDLLVWVTDKHPSSKQGLMRLCWFLPELLIGKESYLQELLYIGSKYHDRIHVKEH